MNSAMTSPDPWSNAYAPPAPPVSTAPPAYGPPVYPGYAYGAAPQALGPQKHSGFGVASFVIGLVTMVLEFGAILVAGVMTASNGGQELPDNDPGMMLLGAFICLGLVLHLVGGIFGIVSLTATDKKRALGGVGLALNGLCALGVIALIILGNMS